jgi:hypothetical protein
MSVWKDEPADSANQAKTSAEHADAGTAAWQATAGTQSWASSRHEDFYVLAGEITQTLYALDDVAATLARQTESYGIGREIYDDTRTANPYARLATAVEHLEQLRGHLHAAQREANGYWSAIGHIGVEYYDTPTVEDSAVDGDGPGVDR